VLDVCRCVRVDADAVDLLELAGLRAGSWPAAATAEIGDTPADVASAKAAGLRSIAVSSPRTDPSELAGAEVIVDDMEGIVRALFGESG